MMAVDEVEVAPKWWEHWLVRPSGGSWPASGSGDAVRPAWSELERGGPGREVHNRAAGQDGEIIVGDMQNSG